MILKKLILCFKVGKPIVFPKYGNPYNISYGDNPTSFQEAVLIHLGTGVSTVSSPFVLPSLTLESWGLQASFLLSCSFSFSDCSAGKQTVYKQSELTTFFLPAQIVARIRPFSGLRVGFLVIVCSGM